MSQHPENPDNPTYEGRSERAAHVSGLVGALSSPAAPDELQLLQAVAGSMAEALAVADAGGSVIFHNSAWLALHGYAPGEEAPGALEEADALWEVTDMAGNRLPTAERPLARALRGERFAADEVRVRCRDSGKTFIGAYSGTPIFDESGVLRYVLITIRDVTQQKEAEERLQQRELQLRLALESADLGVWVHDFIAGATHWDARSREIFGVGAYEPASMERWLDLIHPDERERAREALARATAPDAGGAFIVATRLVRPDGARRWIAIRGRVQFAGEGSGRVPTRLNAVVADITVQRAAAGAPQQPQQRTLQAEIAERREVEEALHESEMRFRELLEGSLDAAYRRDLQNDRYEYMSPTIERITGFTPDEINKLTMEQVWRHIHPEDHEAVRSAVEEGDSAGKGFVEYRFRHKDGHYRWLSDSFVVGKGGDGRSLYRGGTVRDISERKRAEQALREREQEFTTMANSIPQLAWMADGEGWIYWYNRRWYDYTGTTLAEMEGWGWRKVHHPDHVERVVRRIRRSFESGEPWEDTFPLRGKDGEYRWFLSRALPIRDQNGKVVRWFGTNTDITERLQLEQALRRREAELHELNRTLEARIAERTRALARSGEALLEARNRFFTLFHTSPVPTTLVSLDDAVVLDANTAYLHLFGLEHDEVVGKHAARLAARAKAHQKEWEQVRRRLQEEGALSNVEIHLADGAGKERTLLMSVETATLDERPVAVTTLIDVTERVRAQEQVRQLAVELSFAEERERKRIAQILHDDIQQMLVALHIQVELGRRGDADEMRAALSATGASLSEIIGMTRDLSVELTPPALHGDGLQSSFVWLRDFMAERYELAVSVDVDKKATIPNADMEKVVVRLVRELLFNVVKHAGTECAHLSAHMDGNELVIQVRDEGVGFDAATLVRRQSGTGFGLKGMGDRVRLFGGEFEVDSSPGEGTVVTLVVPSETGTS
ncbi:MAG: PAS domain S-box protein [Candidatus Promineifilaceae bacterium]|nr:PAS domain S-box protein [Candidatus Promineifilaceae bacterium]